MSNKRSKRVYCYLSENDKIYPDTYFNSITEASNHFEINRSTLSYHLTKYDECFIEHTDESTGITKTYLLTTNYRDNEMTKIIAKAVEGVDLGLIVKDSLERPTSETITFWRKLLNFFEIKW